MDKIFKETQLPIYVGTFFKVLLEILRTVRFLKFLRNNPDFFIFVEEKSISRMSSQICTFSEIKDPLKWRLLIFFNLKRSFGNVKSLRLSLYKLLISQILSRLSFPFKPSLPPMFSSLSFLSFPIFSGRN